MKQFLLFLLCLSTNLFYSQTINFTGCLNLFNDQPFVFNKVGTDDYNKEIYETTPIDGQPCGGLGTCEFRIKWNNNLTRWEFLADEGYGTFSVPYLIYYNSTGDTNATNPPSNFVGEWVENTTITTGECSGSLNPNNSTLIGDVHNTVLSSNQWDKTSIEVYPNPSFDVITFSGIDKGLFIEIYNTIEQKVKILPFNKSINVNYLTSGVYFLKIKGIDNKVYVTKFIKN